MPTFADPETGAVGDNPGAAYGKQNKFSDLPVSPYDKRALQEGEKHPIRIYNVSPIHEWPKYTGSQMGTVVIPKAPWKFDGPIAERVSTPVTIPGAVCRMYDAGDRKRKALIEGGLEIVEDLLGCSKQYPPTDINANLTNFGCFYVEDSFFHELKVKKQEEIYFEAFKKFEVKCRGLIQKADQLWAGDPKSRAFIAPIHLDSLKIISELTGEEQIREWAPKSAVGLKNHKNCQFCDARNAVNAVKCQNCKEVIDEAGYAKLKAAK